MLLLLLMVAVKAEPRNHYPELTKLSRSEEAARGVVRIPESLTASSSYRGIEFIPSSNRPFTDEEIAFLRECINRLPESWMRTPPKAILTKGKEIRMLPSPFTNAQASGPYIILSDKFFKGSVLSGGLYAAEKYTMFLHEAFHVMQYYYSHVDSIAKPEARLANVALHSSIVDDFAAKTGWEREAIGNNGKVKWKNDTALLEAKTTPYGRRDAVEDMADTFAYILSGQTQYFSPDRIKFVTDFMDLPLSDLVQGFFPIPREAKAVKKMLNMFNKSFPPQALEAFSARHGVHESRHFVIATDTTINSIISFYQEQPLQRGFYPTQPLEEAMENQGRVYASGVYQFDAEDILLELVALKSGSTDKQKNQVLIRTTHGQAEEL